jgi:hypothetical protein
MEQVIGYQQYQWQAALNNFPFSFKACFEEPVGYENDDSDPVKSNGIGK